MTTQDRESPLLAGAAETTATPPAGGTFLIGPMKPSTGVSDDLYARALVLSDGEQKAAIVTLDYLGFDFAFTDVLISAIAEASGISTQHVMLNCSHTHSAPLTAPWGPWERAKDKPFHETLPRRLAEVARQACDRLRPARLRFRREPTQIGFNRRFPTAGQVVMAPNPDGAVLPWVDVLSVEGPDSERIAVLFSHAAHPAIVHEASTLISADYPGFAVKILRERHGKEGVFLFAQGCCGNINAFPLKGGIGAAAAAGRDLGQAVGRALDAQGDRIKDGRLRVSSAELELPLQAPPPVACCEEMLAGEQSAERRERLADLMALARSGRPRTMRFPIRALAVGDGFCILGLPHEPFAEYHLFVNEVSPFRHTMVFGYTNGLECYVGTQKDYLLGERGGYETSPWGAAFMFESRLPLGPEAERRVQKGIRGVLRDLHAASGRRGQGSREPL